MSFTPPQKLKITSDDNVLEFVRVIEKSKIKKESGYVYRYIKSETKKGSEVELSEAYILQQKSNYFK